MKDDLHEAEQAVRTRFSAALAAYQPPRDAARSAVNTGLNTDNKVTLAVTWLWYTKKVEHSIT
jgi:hypothetical protein